MRTPEQTHDALTHELAEGLKAAFPLTGNKHTIELKQVTFDTAPAADNWNGQKDARLSNKTWGTAIRGKLVMKDAEGNQLDEKTVRLGTVPTPTNRHTYIVDGKEYQVANQKRLRSGAYTKLNRLGESVADFNLKKGRNFSVVLDPANNQFQMQYANTHVPLDVVTNHVFDTGLGLGKAFDHEHTDEQALVHLKTLYAETHRNQPIPETLPELKEALKTYFHATQMDGEVNQMTLGTMGDHVNGALLQTAAKKVLAIHRREEDPSGKEQLAYSDIYGVEDLLRERVEKSKHLMLYKLKHKLDRANNLDHVNIAAVVEPTIKNFFTTNSLSNNTAQINPLEMRENAYRLTAMGEGGISDANAIPLEVRNIHPSTAGFIDPVKTPDNSKAGVDVRASLATTKVGKQLATMMMDRRTGKPTLLTATQAFDKYVMHDKEPTDHGVVRAIHRGRIVTVKPEQVDYLIPTESMFTVSTALVPFVSNSHAHRTEMGAKMLSQALSLEGREAPIVDTNYSDMALDGIVPKSPVNGTVREILPGLVRIKDPATHKIVDVHYAHEFPLNGGSYLDTQLHVKVGDAVTAGQILGDNNFSAKGKLALGRNLQVAYLPFKGWNFEDGIVATQSGASKLTSNHLFTHEMQIDARGVHDKKQFLGHFPGKFDLHQVNTLDAHGIVQVGTVIKEGDPIIAALRKRVSNPEQLILGKAHKSILEPFRDSSLTWDRPYEGKVAAVKKTSEGIKVTIHAQAPLMVGDKLAGRWGNKGVVTAIIPDHEAPHTKDGKVPDLMLNSAGLITRMNNGQIYEVAAGKAIQNMGLESHKFNKFMADGASTHDFVKKLVAKGGGSESDEMFDPTTGHSIGKIMNGPMYMLKLFKSAETGFSARSGGQYDIDLRPSKGGEEGAKSVGYLDFFGLLSHGSKNLLRESATYKAEYNPEVFAAMWAGKPLPAPKPTFAWQKFEAMLGGMGVNIKKEGSTMTLLPMTDRDVLGLSKGRIMRPLTVNSKEDPRTGLPFRPEEGGLFDTVATGGITGNRWSHIQLAEPVVNPMYHRAVRTLLGMTTDEFDKTLAAEGGKGFQQRLGALTPATAIADYQAQLAKTNSVSKRDEIYKKLKYLKPLAAHGLMPADAYVLNHVPVIPPNMRPIYPDAETGMIVNADANKLYQNLMLVNDQLEKHADPDTRSELRVALHDALAKVQGLDPSSDAQNAAKEPQGFLKIITGASAKEGFFQSKLISRRQDIAGRGVAVPNPTLGIDQIGLPEQMAWKMYRNHAVGELTKAGFPLDRAAKEIKDQTPIAKQALQTAMAGHPCIMVRAPSLHKFNLQAFKPTLVAGKSIEVNTLIHKGFNLDHDGDAVNIHVPISREGAADAFRMLPSKNLYQPLNRQPVNVPAQETTIGLWKITKGGGTVVRKFANAEAAKAAYQAGQIKIDDAIEVG